MDEICLIWGFRLKSGQGAQGGKRNIEEEEGMVWGE